MGLDMYLYVMLKPKVEEEKSETLKMMLPNGEEIVIQVSDADTETPSHKHVDKEFADFELDSKRLLVGEWRKANQIHGWFVRNSPKPCGECESVPIEDDLLKRLLEDCKKVKADHSLAEELLHPYEGFFFGSYEIDDHYFEQIDETITILEKALAQDWGKYFHIFIYDTSW